GARQLVEAAREELGGARDGEASEVEAGEVRRREETGEGTVLLAGETAGRDGHQALGAELRRENGAALVDRLEVVRHPAEEHPARGVGPRRVEEARGMRGIASDEEGSEEVLRAVVHALADARGVDRLEVDLDLRRREERAHPSGNVSAGQPLLRDGAA